MGKGQYKGVQNEQACMPSLSHCIIYTTNKALVVQITTEVFLLLVQSIGFLKEERNYLAMHHQYTHACSYHNSS